MDFDHWGTYIDKKGRESRQMFMADGSIHWRCASCPHYPKYKSPGWQNFRLALIAKRGIRCERCEKVKTLDLHHLSYDRAWDDEGNCLILCQSCHAREHEELLPKKRKVKPELLAMTPQQRDEAFKEQSKSIFYSLVENE